MEPEELREKTWLPVGIVLEERWVLGEPLGRGGFASVYEARHLKLGRRAAVKVLDLQANPDDLAMLHERFLREAKLSSQLEHPNVVQILDFGLYEHKGMEKPFLVMELLDGHDLEHELLSNGTLAPARAKSLFAGALDALAVSHEAGIVHRDLKPSNLYLVHPGKEDERLVVVDFGIARAFESTEAKLTATNHFTGTPAYLAPEYISEQIVTPALDVYQMGLIITESLTGKPVVQASAPLGYLVAHCNGQQRIPEYLENTGVGKVLRRAVAVEPAARPADARALRQSLLDKDWEEIQVAHDEYVANLDPTLPDMEWDENMTFDEGVVPGSLQATTPDSPDEIEAKATLDFDEGQPPPETPAAPSQDLDIDAPIPEKAARRPVVATPPTPPEVSRNSNGVPVWVVGVLMVALGIAIGVAVMSSTRAPDPPANANSEKVEQLAKATTPTHENNSSVETNANETLATATARPPEAPTGTTATTNTQTAPSETSTAADNAEAVTTPSTSVGAKAKVPSSSARVARGPEPVELLKIEPVDDKLAMANSTNKLVLGEARRDRKSFINAIHRYSFQDVRLAASFNDVYRHYRGAASSLRKAAKMGPADKVFDANANAMASALDDLGVVLKDGYAYRMEVEPTGKVDPLKLQALEERYKVAFAAFEKARSSYAKAYYNLEIQTLEARFAKTDARRTPLMHHFHGALLHSSRALALADASSKPGLAKKNLKLAVEHAEKFARFDLKKELPDLSASARNSLFNAHRGLKAVKKQIEEFRALEARTRLLSADKAEQMIANQWYMLHMARMVQMRRYYKRSL
jgi:serine/threonine protein kinase